MKLTPSKNDLLASVIGAVKSIGSPVPVLGQAIAGYDAYKKSIFDRNIKKALLLLNEKVENISEFIENSWFQTDDGQQFFGKVLDSALDAQLEDKQELFINALINGVNSKHVSQIEKLKFIDMLRHMSRASLLVLAEIHNLFIKNVRGPNRQPGPTEAFPLVNATNLSEELSDKFHPYLINSAVSEMIGQGLFSNIGDWRKGPNGKFSQAGGFSTELCYTDYAANFVEFITLKNQTE